MTTADVPIDEAFFRRRVRSAWALRERVGLTSSCRAVFGEADLLPGLVVDKFGDYLSVQFLTAGIDARRELLVPLLQEVLSPAGIYERDDIPVRKKEGLPLRKGYLTVPFDPLVRIVEHGLPFLVDLAAGNKTGHFLDQRENRAVASIHAAGRTVLDVFCHTGGFGLHALAAGATRVDAIDASAEALDALRRNAELQGVADRITTTVGNAFDALRAIDRDGHRYGLVILDPPAFAKGRSSVPGALRGYKEINLRALRIVEPGGVLVTCSCSHAVTSESFLGVLADAAGDARRTVRILEIRGQPPDHPILVGYEESRYLKCVIAIVE